MKTKKQLLVALVEREMMEETLNYEGGRQGSLRERINALNTTDVVVINETFGVKIHPMVAEYDFVNREYVPASLEKYQQAIVSAVRRQMMVRRAKRKAEEIGLHYWPALLPSYDGKGKVDPLAFVAAEKALLSHGAKPWGTKLEKRSAAWDGTVPAKDTMEHGGWDAMGHWGVSPQQVASCWFASGCKDSGKFRFLVKNSAGARDSACIFAHKLKSLSLQQLRDLLRGQRWLNTHCKYSGGAFSTKAVIALGRISPAARKAAIEGINFEGRGQLYAEEGGSHNGYKRAGMIRIRDLNWGAVKALQTMSKSLICSRYLRGRLAWTYLQGVSAPKGLEKISPAGWSRDRSGVWSSRTVTFNEFSTIAPEGYAFGVDDAGLKLYEVARPESGYHFSEKEARRNQGCQHNRW
jgi:hypothetical protein